MKKWYLVSVLFVFIVFLVFGNTEEQEEIDYLLFLPDSSNLFVNQEQAMAQLDNLAKYLTGRELTFGQIYVYGYAAFAANDIEPINLSRGRASFVINELQKRGVQQDLFSDAVGLGSVDLWGSNDDEEGRSPNRRVRVVLDNKIITPATVKAAEPEIPAASIDIEEVIVIDEAPIKHERKFPWWVFLLPLLGLLFFLLKKRKRTGGKTAKPEKPVAPIIAPLPFSVPAAASKAVKLVTASTVTVYLEDEIRFRAYELFLQRNGQSENHYEDWCRAVIEISAKYKADGYQIYQENGCWWARKVIHSSP